MDPTSVTFNNAGGHGKIAIQAGSFKNTGVINFTNNDDPKATQRREKEIKVLQNLYKSVEINRKDRNPTRVPGTCEWFTHHKIFHEWNVSTVSKLLWVSADPGSGKSVLAKYLVDSVLPMNDSTRTICYFFFKDDFKGQNSAATALCCILWQLFQKKRSLLSEEVLERFEIEGEEFPNSVNGLWDLFMMIAKNNAGEIVCVLDALDECKQSDRDFLIKRLQKLYNSINNLKFLITSRPIFEIRDGFHFHSFPKSFLIHLSGESDAEVAKISQEISIFIKDRANRIAERFSLTGKETDTLLAKLNEVPNRTYLWVYLTLNLIEGDARTNLSFCEDRIIQITSQLPASVDEAYERILSASQDPERAKLLLQILVAAARPLRLREIVLAMQLAVENSPHNSYQGLRMILERPEERIRDQIRDLCGLFVVVVDSAVYLIHQTAKEFLLGSGAGGRDVARDTGQNFQWRRSIGVPDCNRILFYACVRHLFFSEFESDPLGPRNPDSFTQRERERTLEYLERYVFLDYSANQWMVHFRNGDIELDQGEIDWVLQLCDAGSNRLLTWFAVYWGNTNGYSNSLEGLTTLIVVSYLGLQPMVKRFLDSEPGRNSNIDATDFAYGRSALMWAAGNGFHSTTEELLKTRYQITFPFVRKGAKIDAVDRNGRTPLIHAILGGHVLVIKQLLEAGANIYIRDQLGGSPFSHAVCCVRKGYLKDFSRDPLTRDPNRAILKGWISRKSHILAVEEGRDYALKVLVEKNKTLLETTNSDNATALMWYAEKGQLRKLRYLLEMGANIEAKDGYHRTALTKAAVKGNIDIIEFLVEKGANIEAKDINGQTPLFRAVYGEKADAIELLLDKGADIEAKDEDGRTSLMQAAGRGNIDIVGLLVEKGADIEAIDEAGRTSLMRAARGGHTDIFELLLEKGAARRIDDLGNWLWVCEKGRISGTMAIPLLREGGQDLDMIFESGTTLLAQAVILRSEDMTRSLLENGANPNARCPGRSTPHINVNSANTQGLTPLHFALENTTIPSKRILSLLLDNGANVEAADNNGETAILLQIRYMQTYQSHRPDDDLDLTEMLSLLLKSGANTRAADRDGFTPLFRAIDPPFKQLRQVCEQLIKNGAEIATRIIHGEPYSLLYKVISHHLGSYIDWGVRDSALRRSRAEEKHGDLVKFLLDQGADIEEGSKLGPTPLFYALRVGNQIAVSLLLERGAKKEVKGVNGKTIRVLFHFEPPYGEPFHPKSTPPDFARQPTLDPAPAPALVSQRGHLVSKIEVQDEECGPWITKSIDEIDGSDYL
ncbi:hypothetical protein TWF718_003546 [Orbilia javanica]|uniref:protein S-acyltransferase n=1 Tax=Orbilia javanica TaxID=47235 RepID=A0AAN8R800_9PEZI